MRGHITERRPRRLAARRQRRLRCRREAPADHEDHRRIEAGPPTRADAAPARARRGQALGRPTAARAVPPRGVAAGGLSRLQARTTTRANDAPALRRHRRPRVTDDQPRPIDGPADVPRRTIRDRLLADGRQAPQSVADVLRVLSQALSKAEAKGYVGKNVASARLVNRPVGEESSFEVIDAATAGRILNVVRGEDPWDVAVHLALGLGLRREEVLALRWDDVDDLVHVRQTLTFAEGRLHFGGPKSAAGKRDLPLPDFVARPYVATGPRRPSGCCRSGWHRLSSWTTA